MQVYRGMDIGTAKVPDDERSVPYHCLDLVKPDQQFSAACYQLYARNAIDDILSRGGLPVVCGGTGLYIRAALDAFEFPSGDQENNPARRKYTKLHEELGNQGLWDLLDKRDPESAALIHPNNVRRVVRAFELLEGGTSYSQQNKGLHSVAPYYETLYLGLQVSAETLARRIDSRVKGMLDAGLLVEVEGLISCGFAEALCAPQAIGYKEFVPLLQSGYLKGSQAYEASLAEAVSQVCTATRRLAKRQRTWFRGDKRIIWLEYDQLSGDVFSKAMNLIDASLES